MSKKSAELGVRVRGGAPAETKFDMSIPPCKPKAHLMPLAWAVSRCNKWLHLSRLRKVDMKGLKPPFLVMCNHNAFYDFSLMISALFPWAGYIPTAVDGYIGRESLLRGLGTIPKRKYMADIGLVRQCERILARKGIFVIYTEARYCLCGQTEIIPDAVGQLSKRMGVPVVTLKTCGHHTLDPFWGDHRTRWIHPETIMTRIYTPQELQAATAQEISDKIRQYLRHDDFRWQSERRARNRYKKRAQGLHKVLYQCPHCMQEYKMGSQGAKVFCEACGKSWTLSEYGELCADSGETEFTFVTDWYSWEREQVRKQVREGKYRLDCAVHVNDLPNEDGFVRLGQGRLVHDMEGFRVTGTRDWDGQPFAMTIAAAGQEVVHVEYSYCYGNREDCIDLNTLEDTWYVFPEGQGFSVTKVSLATEEIYKLIWENREKQDGIAEKLADALAAMLAGGTPEIDPAAVLACDLGLSSVELYDLVCSLEKRLGIEIPDSALPGFLTLQDVAAYLKSAA